MPNFTKLCIFHAPKCSAITDRVVKILVNSSPNIMELDISDCGRISNEALGEFANLEYLTALNISRTNVSLPTVYVTTNIFHLICCKGNNRRDKIIHERECKNNPERITNG